MRKILCFVVAAILLQTALPVAATVSLALYNEAGDAGDRHHAQDVSGGPYDGFHVDLGGTDTVDAFRFSLAASSGFTINNLSTVNGSVLIKLFAAADLVNTIAAGADTFSTGALGAGEYIIEFNTDLLADPPFDFGIFPLDPGPLPPVLPPPPPPPPVPEPGVLALFLSALLALAARRRAGPVRARARR